MGEIQASYVRALLPQVLDQIERGEVVVIAEHGRTIARITPEPPRKRQEIDGAIEAIRAIRNRVHKVSAEELLSSRHEGHRY
jgi:antitoxin (DNA-binding transcriptional repressor) of toxin-antitoxin stability system